MEAYTEMQVIDIVERYDEETCAELICLVGKQLDGTALKLFLKHVPHELYVAVGESFSATSAESLVTALEDALDANMHGCRRTACACERSGEGSGVNREPCSLTRRRLLRGKKKVRGHEIVRRRGFHVYEAEDRPFLRLFLSHAFFASAVARWVNGEARARDFLADVPPQHFGVYECRAKPVDSFLASVDVASFDWVRFSTAAHSLAHGEHLIPVREMQVLRKGGWHAAVTGELISPLADTQDRPNAALTTLFFDIETISKKYNNSESDAAAYPVGIITCVTNSGDKATFMTGPDFGGGDHVRLFPSEPAMLTAFANFVRELDPDVVCGYNSNMFDVPYLVKRAARLGLRGFASLSRFRDSSLMIHERVVVKNQTGGRKRAFVDCPGRIFMDLHPIILQNYRLENYKLATVASKFNLDSKGDVKYEEIYDTFHGDASARARLEHYALRDAELAREVEQRTDSTRRLVAKCRILRLRANDVLDRGLGYLLSMLIAGEYRRQGYVNTKGGAGTKPRSVAAVPPSAPSRGEVDEGERYDIEPSPWEQTYADEGDAAAPEEYTRELDAAFALVEGYRELWELKMGKGKYAGAYVFEPRAGFIEDAIATFDFNSLYPSIIQTMNVCRSTQLLSARGVSVEEANVSPSGFAFSKAKEGVFPRIERQLVAERKAVRARMKTVSEPAVLAMLDAEQNELKIAANSLYGLLGTITSEVSLLSGAISITSWGAQFIRRTQQSMTAQYGSDTVEVVYGDTDSLFVRLVGVRDIARARELATEMERWVNNALRTWLTEEHRIENGVMKMEAENISMPTVLIEKKRYIKCVYATVPPKGKADTPEIKKSGVETRASTLFTRNTIDACLRMRMLEGREQGAILDFVRARIQALYLGEVEDLAELRRSVSLTREVHEYATPTPHVRAAKQMLAAGQTLNVGDRVEFFYCNVVVPRKCTNSDSVVCASLADRYELKWEFYAEELVKAVENILTLIIPGYDIRAATHPSTFKRAAPKRQALPPPTTRAASADFFTTSHRQALITPRAEAPRTEEASAPQAGYLQATLVPGGQAPAAVHSVAYQAGVQRKRRRTVRRKPEATADARAKAWFAAIS